MGQQGGRGAAASPGVPARRAGPAGAGVPGRRPRVTGRSAFRPCSCPLMRAPGTLGGAAPTWALVLTTTHSPDERCSRVKPCPQGHGAKGRAHLDTPGHPRPSMPTCARVPVHPVTPVPMRNLNGRPRPCREGPGPGFQPRAVGHLVISFEMPHMRSLPARGDTQSPEPARSWHALWT